MCRQEPNDGNRKPSQRCIHLTRRADAEWMRGGADRSSAQLHWLPDYGAGSAGSDSPNLGYSTLNPAAIPPLMATARCPPFGTSK